MFYWKRLSEKIESIKAVKGVKAIRQRAEGFIAAGYLTTVLGIKMKVEETRCAAKGDLNCTFEAKPEN